MMKNNRPEVILIAAMAANRVIGDKGEIPWHVPGEQARFRVMTMGHPLVMGRKTWQAIGRPLPGRRSIVLSRDTGFRAEGAEVVAGLDQALERCRNADKVFIIGGAQIYELALDRADTIVLTVLPFCASGDARFPEFSRHDFILSHSEQIHGSPAYRIEIHCRIKRE